MSGRFWMSRTAASPFRLVDVADPVRAIAGVDPRQQAFERLAQIADEADVRADVLVDLGRVDVDVDLLAPSARRSSRLPVTRSSKRMPKASSRSASWMARVHPRLAVHAHHAQVERMRRRERRRSRAASSPPGISRPLGEPADDVHRAGDEDAVTGEDERALGRVNQIERVLDLARDGTVIAAGSRAASVRRATRTRRELCCAVLRDVDQHRARTSRARHVEGLAHDARDFVGPGDEVVVLGDRQRDAGDVGLLERIGSNQLAARPGR